MRFPTQLVEVAGQDLPRQRSGMADSAAWSSRKENAVQSWTGYTLVATTDCRVLTAQDEVIIVRSGE